MGFFVGRLKAVFLIHFVIFKITNKKDKKIKVISEQTLQMLNVTKEELVAVVKEGVKLELNRQRSMGNPKNQKTRKSLFIN